MNKAIFNCSQCLTPLPEVFSATKFWWFFIFIIRSLPQHNTVDIAIYTSRWVLALFWHRHVQPRFRYTTPISDISDIEFLADASRLDVLIERFQTASSKDFFRAFAILMASFYVFNVEYPKKLEGTLIFIQKNFWRRNHREKYYDWYHQ